jgi:hypothetical protein
MRPSTLQATQGRSIVGQIVQALADAAAHYTKAIDKVRSNGGTRAAGNAPGAERRDARGPLRDHAIPVPANSEMGHQRPTGPPRYWPNPSSTEGGRPWPPALPHW